MSRLQDDGPGKVLIATSSDNSVESLERLLSGEVDIALCEADLAVSAFAAGGIYKQLRTLLVLYTASLHLATLPDSPVQKLEDLRTQRIGWNRIDWNKNIEQDALTTRLGLDLSFLSFLSAGQAASALRSGKIAAFFVLDAAPNPVLLELARYGQLRLVPLSGAAVRAFLETESSFRAAVLPSATYPGIPTTSVLQEPCLCLVRKNADQSFVRHVLERIFAPQSRSILLSEHPILQHLLHNGPPPLPSVGEPPLHIQAEVWYMERNWLRVQASTPSEERKATRRS